MSTLSSRACRWTSDISKLGECDLFFVYLTGRTWAQDGAYADAFAAEVRR